MAMALYFLMRINKLLLIMECRRSGELKAWDADLCQRGKRRIRGRGEKLRNKDYKERDN